MVNTEKYGNVYFAAANTPEGFVSYFPKIFSSDNFSRGLILKGGPGCGKSSFIKGIVERYRPLCDLTESFACSSDTNSLDGAILRSGDRAIAIVDGTAPHVREQELPQN